MRTVQQVIEQGLERVCIQTDSAYVHKCITCWINNWMANGWKTAQGAEVKHRVLLESLYDQCKKVNVIWRHVKGHAGDPGNEAADILSKMATDRQKEATTRNVKETAGKTSTSRNTSAEKGGTSLTIKNQMEEQRGRAESEPQDVLTEANYAEIPKKSAKKETKWVICFSVHTNLSKQIGDSPRRAAKSVQVNGNSGSQNCRTIVCRSNRQ